jgi:hypothetical protein
MLSSTFARAGMLEGVEEVLVGSPDDVCLHLGYASALLRQGDPANMARARYIQTQLKLEESGLSSEERRKLGGRERKFLRDHARAWLGELAAWLVDRPGYKFTLWRGWLESVQAPELDAAFVARLAASPRARLLRRLVIDSDQPGGAQALAPLLDAGFLAGMCEFRLGETGVGAGAAPAEVIARLVEGR